MSKKVFIISDDDGDQNDELRTAMEKKGFECTFGTPEDVPFKFVGLTFRAVVWVGTDFSQLVGHEHSMIADCAEAGISFFFVSPGTTQSSVSDDEIRSNVHESQPRDPTLLADVVLTLLEEDERRQGTRH